jgi:hypothetical protein
MGYSLATEIDVSTKGTATAAADLQRVAAASRQIGDAGERGGMGINHLARAFGQLGGANREVFMLIRGITEATETAEGSWSKFAGAIGDTAVFAGAAIGIAFVIDKAKELSKETDELWEKAGQRPQGLWHNLLQGFGLESSPHVSGYVDDEEKDRAIERDRARRAKEGIELARTENSPEKNAEAETYKYAEQHSLTAAGYTKVYNEYLSEQKAAIEGVKEAERQHADMLEKVHEKYRALQHAADEMKERQMVAGALGQTDLAANLYMQMVKNPAGWGNAEGLDTAGRVRFVEGLAAKAEQQIRAQEEAAKEVARFESKPHYQSALMQGSAQEYEARMASSYRAPMTAESKAATEQAKTNALLQQLVQRATGVQILSLTGAS